MTDEQVSQPESLDAQTTLSLVKKTIEDDVERAYSVEHMKDIKNTDVILLRYDARLTEEQCRMYYEALRKFFNQHSMHPRILGLPATVSLERMSELEMAKYGWFKKR